MSKATDDIRAFLEWEDFKFHEDKQGEDTDIFYFGAQGDNVLKFLFIVEKDADVIQFRLWDVLEDDEKEKIGSNESIRLKLLTYLLQKNYQYKLGKWAMDEDDHSLNFVIAHHEEVENGIDKSLLKRVKSILFSDGDDMITEIKEIINGTQSTSDSSDKSMENLLKALGNSGI